MGDNIKEFLEDNNFSLTIKNNFLNVINYTKIIILEDTKISFLVDDKTILVIGNNLKLLKLLDNEILVSGVINKIEFR
ncbi:MAG: hypothetical protein IKN87_02795 [Bacilli bacterium]|nr:hypothetical protein [Bacilli bacterium]